MAWHSYTQDDRVVEDYARGGMNDAATIHQYRCYYYYYYGHSRHNLCGNKAA